jgi:hypothetical protein
VKPAVQAAALWVALAGLTGCGEESERAENEPSEVKGAQLFEKGKGVRLPPDMRQQLGVVTVEVAERVVAGRARKPAQVCRAANASRPAAAVSWFAAEEAGHLRVGQTVSLRALLPEAREFSGVLQRFETNGSRAPGQVEGVIEFEDREGRFSVGSFLEAAFAAPRTNTVLAVPASAVVDGVAGAFVYAVNGAHFTRTAVKTGATDNGLMEITDGLYAGDVVAAKAADSLWLIELSALKGGSPCCPAPMKSAGKQK